MSPRHLGFRGLLAAALLVLTVLTAACSQEDAPPVPEEADGTQDPVLVEGREIWSDQCARCHGGDGGGGSGPNLSEGRTVDAYPDAADMEAVVAEGRNAMPAFGDSLTPEQIDAVTAYVREVL